MEGYVRQRGSTWSYTVDIGKYLKVKGRKQKTKGGFPDERSARKALEKLIDDLEAGKRPTSITFKELALLYYETEEKHQLEEMTYHTRLQVAEDYIFPRIGHMKIDGITHFDLSKFYKELLDDDVSRGIISKHIAAIIGKVFRIAVIWKHVLTNENQYVKVPTYTPKEMQVWSIDEMQTFLARAKDSKHFIIYEIALATGMRLGEILALHWDDIDFKESKIRINKSLKYSLEKGLHLKVPKTKNSYRTIDIPRSVLNKLKQHQLAQLPGIKIINDNLGKFILPSEASRHFRSDCVRFGMRPIRFHDLRHTHATILLEKGFNAKVVSERLGNTVATVLKTYAHVTNTMQAAVVKALDDIMEPVDNFGDVVNLVVNK